MHKSKIIPLLLAMVLVAASVLSVNAETLNYREKSEAGAVQLRFDANNDGKVDVSDATITQMFSARAINLPETVIKCLDFNKDGRTDISDATCIQMFAAKIIDINGKRLIEPPTPKPTEKVPTTAPTTQPSTKPLPTTAPVATTVPVIQTMPAETKPTEPTSVQVKVELDVSEAILGIDEVLVLSPSVMEKKANITFSSDNTSVVTVDNNGRVTPRGLGTAVITCSAAVIRGNGSLKTINEGLNAKCKITVRKATASLAVNKTSLTMGVGERYTLQSIIDKDAAANERTYTSSDPNVANVDSRSGNIVAEGEGTAIITCTIQNGLSASCKVTVKPFAKQVSLNKTDLVIGVGDTFDFDSHAPSGSAALWRLFYSENPGIIEIKEYGGIATAKAEGTTRVYCELYEGTRTYANVTVVKTPAAVSINKNKAEIKVGETLNLYAAHNNGAYTGNSEWTSSDPKIIKLISNEDGKTTWKAMCQGRATITVKTYGSLTAVCSITVNRSIVKLVDVSYCQPGLDMNLLKKAGIDYVIMKIGEGSTKDGWFETHYKNARAAGLKIGGYWVLSDNEAHNNVEGVRYETKTCLKFLNGRQMDLPIYYDTEYERHAANPSSKGRAMVNAFCEEIVNGGYKAGVYFSKNCEGMGYVVHSEMKAKGYSMWRAWYTNKYTAQNEDMDWDYDIWQYAYDTIPGYNIIIDMNYLYNLNLIE